MLKTKRLDLVGFDVKYAKDFFELWSDFEVIKYTFTPLLTTIDECINLIEQQIIRTNKDFMDRFVILLNNKAIGMIGCICMDKENLVYGLYYQISRVHWGCGYASEAASVIVQYVLKEYPNAIFKAEAVSENPASAAVLKKIGLKQTYIERNGFKRNNFELDLIHYSNV
ncbi:GNAT family N-acetyltransferase [Anaerocolumna chitinilytica]|uniref:N-acetyltransferase n=1 Tax=Anaerocolumna chitinilytica TaxID=1727145 RepID=A0A7I8DHY0_9FIRM|nr:GNAT family N-acetyltransferase [Anaerocolumna chitinilytica]BCJ98039.1 N-acetyltransferase [Anaerocolumna chitinilytica]